MAPSPSLRFRWREFVRWARLDRGRWLPLAAIALGALALRGWRLTAQSLWLDEGVSVYFANLGPARIWQLTFSVEPNPPLYHLLHWAWLSLFGQSEAAVRGLSAVAGALCVLPAYALARMLADERAGLLAALATATSPYLLWYSQEARAFALLGLLGATLLLLSYRLTLRFSALALGLWAAVATLVLYTHLYGAFAVAACALFLLVALPRRWPWLLLAIAVPVLLYLPWLRATLAHNNPAADWRAPLSAAQLLDRALAAVVHNGTLTTRAVALASVSVALVLAAVGLASRGWRAGLLLGVAVALPLAASYALSLIQPIFSERYIIIIAVPLYIAFSLGIVFLGRWLRGIEAVAALALLVLCAQGIHAYTQPAFSKENFRAAAQRVAQSASADDVILFVAEYARFPFQYYYSGPARLLGFTGDHQDPGPWLEGVVSKARVVWLVESHAEQVDPQHQVRRWLAERYPLATEAYPQGVQVRAFAVRSQLSAPPASAQLVGASAGPLRLVAADWPTASAARDPALHPPSAWLPVTLYWEARTPPAADYHLAVQMVDSRGVWGASLERQTDLFHMVPTSRWSQGPVMVESVDVNLNPATPPGRFHLQVRVLDPAGNALKAYDAAGQELGDAIPLGDVEIVDPAASSPLRRALGRLAAAPGSILSSMRRWASKSPQ